MKTNSTLNPLLALSLALAWMCGTAGAGTIFWGSPFPAGPPLLVDSHGQPLDGSYSFEIGSFGAFVPTYANVDQWVANWKVFDRAFDPTPADAFDGDPEGWNTEFGFFAGTVNHNLANGSDSPDANPLDVFATGEKVYLWAYNSKDIVPTSEWALVTDSNPVGNLNSSWLFPDPNAPTPDADYQLADADEAIIGGVNDVQGPGEYSVTPPSFSLQTAVVPEPGSAFLLFAAAAAHFIRRSRRLTRSVIP